MDTMPWAYLVDSCQRSIILSFLLSCQKRIANRACSNPSIQVMDPAREAVRRKPFDLGIRVEKSAVDSLRAGPQDTMKADGVRHVGLVQLS